MALYAIGDLHLSLTANKSMEVFGPAWEHYVDRIGESLSQLSAEDVLVLAGDTSWGIDLAEAEADFRFLEQFPCKKLLVKGNHDYWWSTVSKMKAFFQDKGFANLGTMPCAAPGGGFWRRSKSPTMPKSSTGRSDGWRHRFRRQGSGRCCAFCTIRPCIRATGVPRSSVCWKRTG